MYDSLDNYINEIKKALINLEIKKGDILYVASDITYMMHMLYKQGINTKDDYDIFLGKLIDLLQDMVTIKGTLLFPMFTWTFCQNKIYDVRHSKSEVGSLNNWIIDNRKEFVRTKHPIYSFMVWGNDSDLLKKMDNIDSWGADSPFSYLHKNKGKMLLLNVSLQRAFTFMHYVEKDVAVPYRYTKMFHGLYIDELGVETKKSYSMYVRDLSIDLEEYEPDSFLETANVMKGVIVNGLSLKVIDLFKAYDVVREDLLYHNGENCYHFKNYVIDWKGGATHEDDFGNRLS